MPGEDVLGEKHKPNRKAFTKSQMSGFRRAWLHEVRRIEKRLAEANVDFAPLDLQA
jgi:hypothetical protein